jgi:hypothetical protein
MLVGLVFLFLLFSCYEIIGGWLFSLSWIVDVDSCTVLQLIVHSFSFTRYVHSFVTHVHNNKKSL